MGKARKARKAQKKPQAVAKKARPAVNSRGIFPNFSFFEFKITKDGINIFSSAFDSLETTAFTDEQINRLLPSGQFVFDSEITATQFRKYKEHLVKYNLGINDNVGYLFPKEIQLKDLSTEMILSHLQTLHVQSITRIGETHHNVVLVSNMYPLSPITLKAHQESLPQRAFDVITPFVDTDNLTVTVPVARRSDKSSNVGGITVLNAGLPGNTCFGGEHAGIKEIATLQAMEKKRNGKILPVDFLKNPMAKRAIEEELGEVDVKEFGSYLVHKDDTKNRDLRYSRVDGYGYLRRSLSWIFAVYFMNGRSKHGHTDTEEISSVSRVLLTDLAEKFGTDEMPAAFPSHFLVLPKTLDSCRQINQTYDFKSRFIQKYGPKKYKILSSIFDTSYDISAKRLQALRQSRRSPRLCQSRV